MRKSLVTLLIISVTFVLLPVGHIESAQSQDGDNESAEVPENTTADWSAGDICSLGCCLADILGVLGLVSLTKKNGSQPLFVEMSSEG
tara:strand:+ start:271 stop:534 length:264 start_codon:yes stop_codon:yes gene_type:complete